jgi:hypothetical protein
MTVIGTIYKTKTGRIFLVQEQLLEKKKGHYKFMTYEELNDPNDLTFKKGGLGGYEKTKSEALKKIKDL